MKLTIFTPVYNRCELLMNLYKSLCQQTVKQFVWLIVDDGSTDGTKEQIEFLTHDAPFEIRYYFQHNHGKHSAHNKGVQECDTELFVCVDSDDTLYPNAVQEILDAHEQYKTQDVLGYYFRKIDSKGNISGGNFDFHSEYVGLRELYHRYRFQGELVIVLRTEKIRTYEFPVFANEKFVSEHVLYNLLDNLAPMVWKNIVIYEYEYQENGYSKNSKKLVKNNPYGTAYGYLSEVQYAYSLIERVKNYAAYLGIKKVFVLDSLINPQIRVPVYIRLSSVLLKKHYEKIFQIIKNDATL